jgi:hypothetical protein
MKAETERVFRLLEPPSGEQVASDSPGRESLGRIDVEVDEARKDERLGRPLVRPVDCGDPSVLDYHLTGEGTLHGVDQKSL